MKLMKSIVNNIFADKNYSEKHKQLLEELFRSLILVCTAVFTIVVACLAWFASNTSVQSGGASISAKHDKVILATKGEREEKEQSLFRLPDGSELPEGTQITYNDETYYCTDNNEIALRLESKSEAVSPGATGEITFYVIPEKDGIQSVNLHLVLAGFEETKDEHGNTVGNKIQDIVLNSLISGHILLFQNNANGVLNNWVSISEEKVSSNGINYSITATNNDAKKDEPWPIKIYWVWPLRYENMAHDYHDGQLDSFINSQLESNSFKKINEVNPYQYNQIFLSKSTDLRTLERKSDAYNQADEYIGKKADCLYVSIQTELMN